MSPSDLALIADALIGRHGRIDGAMLVRIERRWRRGRPECGLDFGLRPLDCHPVDALMRLRVPPSWVGLGVVCGGWAAPLDGGRPSAHPDAQRIVVVVLVGRDGAVVSRMRWPDGTVISEVPADGEVLQAMRLALGLPGQDPPSSAANLAG